MNNVNAGRRAGDFLASNLEFVEYVCDQIGGAGVKSHFIIDSVDNQEQMARFIRAACDELSVPKPKKKKE